MNQKIMIRTVLALCIPWALVNAGTGNLDKDEIQAINRAIQAKGAKWTAGENKMTRIPLEELNFMRGAQPEMPDVSKMRKIQLPQIQNLPSHFDWRDNNGNWVTPAKDQLMQLCKSCGIFAAFAQVESWWKINNQKPDSVIDLSEQYLISCGGFSCGSGYTPFSVLDFVKKNDIPTEDCLPYQASNAVSCKLACTDGGSRTVRIPDWGLVTGCENIDVLKNVVYRQPVSVSFTVNRDILTYKSGVYENISVVYPPVDHAVIIVGWDDTESCWICKNCWGEDWGENGFFRIKWGAPVLWSGVPFIWSGKAETGSLAVSPAEINASLTLGDSAETHLALKNWGAAKVEFLARGTRIPTAFHPDAFNAPDERAWWCGDPQIKGYRNVWLQYLDLPPLNLSGTTNPTLTFMGFWAVETPSQNGDYDGYDGCNVWISTDGEKTFKVISPVSPEYNCSSLACFGTTYFNLGKGIPGWGGESAGWIPMGFDLSGFKSDSVVVRFAFASDGGFCTSDIYGNNPSWLGFFVDEIRVSDGTDLIFENDGEYQQGIRASCVKYPTINSTNTYTFPYEIGVPWLTLQGEYGEINQGDSTLIGVSISTADLEAGPVEGLVRISTNDPAQSTVDIPVRLNVLSPEHDLALKQMQSNLALFLYNPLRVKVLNYGLNDETDFDLACLASANGLQVYRDTVHVPLVKAGKSLLFDFKPICCKDSVNVDIQTEILHMNSPDANLRNNRLVSQASVTNLVDDFEMNTGLFDFGGGWGITEKFKHSGSRSVHVNKGENYQPGADAVMTLKPGLDLYSLENPSLKYWVMGGSVKNLDVLFVEASPDSESWMKLDSLSGTVNRWTEREVGLKPVLKGTPGIYRVRFHFISRSKISRMGFMIDDIGVFGAYGSGNGIEILDNAIPDEWALDQNYPNPFNPTTTISYSLAEKAYVSMKIHDMLGREIRSLVAEDQAVGSHRVEWDGLSGRGERAPSGIYFYTLTAKGFHETRKLVMLR
jgi:hypothetical protein